MIRSDQSPASRKQVDHMLIPIRCWTCNTPIAHMYNIYCSRTGKGESRGKVMNDLSLTRMCCRRMFMCNVMHMPDLILSSQNNTKLSPDVKLNSTRAFCKTYEL